MKAVSSQTLRAGAAVAGGAVLRPGVMLLACALLLAAGCEKPAEEMPEAPPVSVGTMRLARETLSESYNLTGILRAYREVDIVAEVSGSPERVLHDVGDEVPRGAVLAVLEKEVPQASLRQAEAALLAAEARARVAAADFRRDSTLHAAGDIAAAVFEASRMAAQTARADYLASQATRDLAARELRETEIRAPLGGRVARRMIDEGGFVTRGTPVFRIVDLDSLKLSLSVSQRDVARIEIGDPVWIDTGLATVQGRIRRIAPEADAVSRTFPVEVVLPNTPAHDLRAGMVVRATLQLSEYPDVLAVPKDAVLTEGGAPYVFVVVHDTLAVRRPVVPGSLIDDRVIIEAGLAPGERIIHVGLTSLRDSTRIHIDAGNELPAREEAR